MTLNARNAVNNICRIIDTLIVNARAAAGKEMLIKLIDQINATGSVIRKLFISLKIQTSSFVRSYANRRFLNSRVEITLKSKIGETNRGEK